MTDVLERGWSIARADLVAAWSEAGLAGDALEPVLVALDGGDAALRELGENVLRDVVQPAAADVYAAARRATAAELDDLEERRLALQRVVSRLRFLGAIEDRVGREPTRTVHSVRQARGA